MNDDSLAVRLRDASELSPRPACEVGACTTNVHVGLRSLPTLTQIVLSPSPSASGLALCGPCGAAFRLVAGQTAVSAFPDEKGKGSGKREDSPASEQWDDCSP